MPATGYRSSSAYSVGKLVAYGLASKVRDLRADLAPDVRKSISEAIIVEMHYLNGSMAEEEITRVLEICREAPELLEQYGHHHVASVLVEILAGLKARVPDPRWEEVEQEALVLGDTVELEHAFEVLGRWKVSERPADPQGVYLFGLEGAKAMGGKDYKDKVFSTLRIPGKIKRLKRK